MSTQEILEKMIKATIRKNALLSKIKEFQVQYTQAEKDEHHYYSMYAFKAKDKDLLGDDLTDFPKPN